MISFEQRASLQHQATVERQTWEYTSRAARPLTPNETPYLVEGVWYADLEIPMLDWDVGFEGMTHDRFWQVIVPRMTSAPMSNDGRYNQPRGLSWRIYETPGGYRGLAPVKMDMLQWLSLAQDYECDSRYAEICVKRGAWACRLSPKLAGENDWFVQREEDWVAEYLCTTPGIQWQDMGNYLSQCIGGLYSTTVKDISRIKDTILFHDAFCQATRNAPYPHREESRWSAEQKIRHYYWRNMEEVAPILLDLIEEEKGLPMPNLVVEGTAKDEERWMNDAFVQNYIHKQKITAFRRQHNLPVHSWLPPITAYGPDEMLPF